LNRPFPSVAQCSFWIIALHPYVTSVRTKTNHIVYSITYNVPNAKLCGKTIPRSNAYVGEHVANIGPSEAPSNISQPIVPFCFALCAIPCTFCHHSLFTILVHASGNNNVNPYKRIIVQDIDHQKLSGIVINAVVALSSNVNITINTHADPIMTNGLYRFCEERDPHIITGSTGSTQGAKIVSIPANIANQANTIRIYQ